MKAAIGIVVVLLALVGVGFGLIFLHVIKADKLAKSSPIVASLLTKVGLYKPRKPVPPVVAVVQTTATPAPDITAEKQALDAEKAQIDSEKASLATPRSSPDPAQIVDNAPLPQKLVDIYNTMSPDDLARIFAKQEDYQVAKALASMDERKSGKVMAALPAERAARLAILLSRMPSPSQDSAQPSDSSAPNNPTAPVGSN